MHVILKYFPITSVELRPLYQRITLTVWMEQKGWSKWVTRPLSAVQRLPILNLPYKVIRGLSLNIQLYYHHRSSRYMKHGTILKQIWVSITDTVSSQPSTAQLVELWTVVQIIVIHRSLVQIRFEGRRFLY